MSDWLNDLKEWGEELVDDAEDWLGDAADDLLGDDNWARDLVDRASDAVGGTEGVAGRLWSELGERVDGTWAESPWTVIDDDGVGGLVQAGVGLLGDQVEGSWMEGAWNTASGFLGGDDESPEPPEGADASAPVADVGTAGQAVTAPPQPDAGTGLTAAGDAQPAPLAEAITVDPARGVMGPAITEEPTDFSDAQLGDTEFHILPAPSGTEPGTIPLDGAEVGSTPIADGPSAIATAAAASGAPITSLAEPTAVATEIPVVEHAPAVVDVAVDEPVVSEPAVVEEPTAFDESIAAADQAEDSIDALFDDLG